jgi:formate dehydrogenase major subunit
VDIRKLFESWPVYQQLTGDDKLGRGKAAQSKQKAAFTQALTTMQTVTLKNLQDSGFSTK